MVYEKKPRSWSQLEQYTACPYSYYLERIEKVWSRPAAWFPMGTAVHSVAEAYERSGRKMSRVVAKAVFKETYADETNEYLDETPNAVFWHSSGRYRGPEDIIRRYGVGLEHVDRYIDYCEAHPQERIAVRSDGEPALELYFEIDLDGVTVRGYLDQAVQIDANKIKARDIKTGANPGKPMQLSIYDIALEEMFPGMLIEPGDFLMTRAKTKAKPVAFTVEASERFGRNEVSDRFNDMEESLKAENFEPKPGPDCRQCGVNNSCPFYK